MMCKCIAIDVEVMDVKYMTGYLDPFCQGHLDLIVFKFLRTDEKTECSLK